ncbi:hypothetical protein BDZ89DRAFT_1043906 [Hymenopellis radicata]|nr:hypothetical protein BDZ89DRAFT_1043906 [Hymenopellis radicata]
MAKSHKRKVSDTAETPQAKRLSTPQDASPQDEIASGSVVPAARSQLQIYQSFRHTLGSRPEVRAITIQDDSLSLCFKKLVRRLNNSDLLASLYQYPDWTNYYGLDIILQDVLQFCGQVDSAPYPTHSDVVSARDAAEPLVDVLLKAKLFLPVRRPDMIADYVEEVQKIASTPPRTRNPRFDNVESLNRLKPRQWVNDDIINYLVHVWNEVGMSSVRVTSTFFGLKYLMNGASVQDALTADTHEHIKDDVIFGFKANLRTMERLLIPVHKGLNHWVVLFADFTSREMGVVDSLSCSLRFKEQICARLQDIITAYWCSHETGSPPTSVKQNRLQRTTELCVDR